MKNLLFIDDDQQLLDSLRDLLRKQRREWNMEFARGVQPALDALEKRAFDVVVCDMRMPGMDGAALLTHVKEHWPSAARIVLSGQADVESAMRAVPAAHQFLSKPCDAERLRSVIERTCRLQQLLADTDIRSIVGRLDRLPSTPETYWALTRAAGSSAAGVAEFARIIEQDPAMSIKVLQLVNSAYFGLPQQITSVKQAVGRLGVELLKALALSVHAFGTLRVPAIEGFSVEQVQQHSLLVARIASKLVSQPSQAAEVFSAAVVHDIGKLVLAVGIPERFAKLRALQAETQRPFHELEREELGVSHAEVAAYLLGCWGLPFQLVELVAFHHTPSVVTSGPLETLAAVHIADVLSDPRSYRPADPSYEGKLDSAFVTRAGLTSKLAGWRGMVSGWSAESPPN